MELYLYLAAFFLAFSAFKLLSRKKHNYPPGPRALPVVGNLHLIKPPLYRFFQTASGRFGPIMLFWMGRTPFLVVSSPDAVEECFTKNDIIFADRPNSMSGDHLTYNYQFLVWAHHGPLWKNLRRLTYTEIFSLKALQRSAFVREEETSHFAGRLLRYCSSGKTKLNMKYMFSLLASSVIMRVAAGKRHVAVHDEDTEEERRRIKEFKELFFPVVTPAVGDYIPVLRTIGYKGVEKGMIRLAQKRDVYLNNLVAEVRAKRKASGKRSSGEDGDKLSSVADTVLNLQETQPELYTDDIVKSLVMMMFIAGTETSTTVLEWSLTLLLQHPNKMQKLQAEIDGITGESRLMNESDLPNLPYLRAVVKEALRLFPPVPLLLPHFSTDACTVGGYDIPKGTMLLVNVWAMHRDPKLWDEPTEFRPERFVETNLDTYLLVPFGVGRRACAGNTMGTHMVCVALGVLMQCFDWDQLGMDEDMSHAVGAGTLSKGKPLEASFAPRPKMTNILSSLLS
uniref:TXS-like protein n=1 Tax=Hypericum perforatum TaxID=65561 RepID=A0A161IM14_HYPPE|nr:TXS-like protein [Hypericum perforatum]